jgi:hypothetical protein
VSIGPSGNFVEDTSRPASLSTPPLDFEEELAPIADSDSWSYLSVNPRSVTGEVSSFPNILASPLASESMPGLGTESKGLGTPSIELLTTASPYSPATKKSEAQSVATYTRSLLESVLLSQKDDPILSRMNRLSITPDSPDSVSRFRGNKRERLTASPDLRTTPREQLRDLFSMMLSRTARPRPVSMSVLLEKKFCITQGPVISDLGLGSCLTVQINDAVGGDNKFATREEDHSTNLNISPCFVTHQLTVPVEVCFSHLHVWFYLTDDQRKVDGLPLADGFNENLSRRPLSFPSFS